MSERILIPLDGSGSSEAAIYQVMSFLCDIKPAETTEIILLEVVKPPVKHIPVEGGTVDISGGEAELQSTKDKAYQYLKELTGKLKLMGVDVSCEVIVSQGNESTADTIIRAEKELNSNLVAMSLPEKHGLRHWTTHHTAEKVLDHGSVPVIMIATRE
ncbi:MAG: universal stress protein [Dehalococcoidales bacterium]|nr:MAG: universal stress protein [Dehalococcoidales bacterium]